MEWFTQSGLQDMYDLLHPLLQCNTPPAKSQEAFRQVRPASRGRCDPRILDKCSSKRFLLGQQLSLLQLLMHFCLTALRLLRCRRSYLPLTRSPRAGLRWLIPELTARLAADMVQACYGMAHHPAALLVLYFTSRSADHSPCSSCGTDCAHSDARNYADTTLW